MQYNILLVILFISSSLASYNGNWALSFDGVSSIVKIGHMFTDLTMEDSWTLEAWVKPYGNQASQFQPNIVGFPGRHPQLQFCGNTDWPGCVGNPTRILTQLRDIAGNYFTMVGGTSLPETTSTWYHIAASWDNQTLSSYVNGKLDGTTSPYSNGYVEPLNCSTLLCDEGIDIGGYRFTQETGGVYNRQYFQGLIDEVRIWYRARSAMDIEKYMGSTLTGNEDGLLYYWRFDEGTGDLVTSLASPAYGTLGGGVLAAEPKWVTSDAPIINPYPQPGPTSGNGPIICTVNQEGVYVAGTILGIVFILVGIVIGYIGATRCRAGSESLPLKS